MRGLFLSLVLFLFLVPSGWACPTVKRLEVIFDKFFPAGEVKILEINPTPVKGICEVIVRAKGKKRLTYVDESGRYLIVGRLIDTITRKDITQERLAELNRLNKEDLKKLDSVVAFTVGKGPVVYLIIDPECPHCKRAENIIFPLAKKGEITVKVILMPLERLHPNAKKKAVGIICDKKGLKELISGYEGSMCPEGQKKVSKAKKILLALGVRATPTYIFGDGKMIAGVLDANKILSLARSR